MTSSAEPGSLTFIGTATTIIRFGELALLTDPNFLHRGQRAYLGYGLSSARRTDPAMTVDQLPELSAIVLSHLHGDHWDRVAHRGLDHDLPVVTTPHAARRLQWRGYPRAIGLRTWTSHVLSAGRTTVRITALPARHAPGPLRRLLPPVMGSMLEFSDLGGPVDLRVYLSGDTLLVEELREIPRRFPRIDTGVLHLGGTRLPGGLMVTMDGRQGADAMQLIDADRTIPIHYDDYPVFASPLDDFRAEVLRRGWGDRVRFVERGQTVPLTGDRPGTDGR
ncbi:MBL fold metallo-hydrolase [Nakamurella sp.]|uniref:MBL fold metallo-hydrolase n=1 Tax=Nakamurella sp. TaxID=1869182 RepID=UPI003B3A6566